MNAVVGAIRVVLAGLFLWAGVVKLLDPWGFLLGVEQFGAFPRLALGPIALAVPVLEILTGLLLLGSRGRRPGALLALGFGLVFAWLFLGAGLMGRTVACGCFGGRADPTSPVVGFARAVVIIVGAAAVYARAFVRELREIPTLPGAPRP
jgi:uncharacterized membrane protein YphA (DoxX/SURF4 family)